MFRLLLCLQTVGTKQRLRTQLLYSRAAGPAHSVQSVSRQGRIQIQESCCAGTSNFRIKSLPAAAGAGSQIDAVCEKAVECPSGPRTTCWHTPTPGWRAEGARHASGVPGSHWHSKPRRGLAHMRRSRRHNSQAGDSRRAQVSILEPLPKCALRGPSSSLVRLAPLPFFPSPERLEAEPSCLAQAAVNSATAGGPWAVAPQARPQDGRCGTLRTQLACGVRPRSLTQ